jgi:sarcosine oxidase
VREETPVIALAPAATGVEVHTASGPLRADVAVVAAGAWAWNLLAPTGIDLPLRVTREQVAYFEQETASALPTLIDWHDGGGAGYAVPDPAGPGRVKLGDHMIGPVVDPDTRTFDPDPDGLRRIEEWAARRFSGLRATGVETCLYTTTPDEDFVLDRMGTVVVGSACSGHGFKFAPLVGEWLAALAVGDVPPPAIERFRATRPSLARTK